MSPLRSKLLPAFLLASAVFLSAGRSRELSAPDLVEEVLAGAPQDRLAAISKLETALSGNLDAEVEPWALLYAGEQRRLAGDTREARDWFARLAERFPTHPLKEPAILGIALVDAERSLSGNVLATMQLVDDRGVPDTMNADRYRILARTGADEGTAGAKVRDYTRRAVDLAAGDPSVAARVQRSLGDLVEGGGTAGTAATGASAEETALARIRRGIADREHARVLEDGARFLAAWPESAHALEVGYLVKRAEVGDPTIANRVGVLLPLSGVFAPAAGRIKADLEFAAEGRGIELLFKDTAGDPAQTTAALEELVLSKGCVAILGPLHIDDVLVAAPVAQALRVPLVSLTQSGRPTELGDFIFRAFLPVEQQVDALLDYAMGTRGYTRFAMLYPTSTYGESAQELFSAAVKARGGEVVRSVSYDPEASDFLDPARTLGNKDYKARASEFYQIKQDYKRRNLDPDKAVLPPVIDYDAIFLPDNWRRVALVASSLAYEEFPVGRFKPNRDAEALPLLGLNAWNDPRIVSAGGKYLQDSIFVDAFLPTDEAPAVHAFTRDYQARFEHDPQVIDAVSVDALKLVAAAARAGGASREAVRDQLLEARLEGPIGAGAGFGADREVQRQLLVLTVAKDGVRRWVPPEEALPPEGLPPPE